MTWLILACAIALSIPLGMYLGLVLYFAYLEPTELPGWPTEPGRTR